MSQRPRFSVARLSLALLVLGAAMTLNPVVNHADDLAMIVKSNQKIAFMGDSITAFGAINPAGYVNLVMAGLKANGVSATVIPAGVSGNTSKDMLARIDRDVISKKPDIMTLSCGVNDVWHGEKGVELDQYKINITSIVDKAQAAGIKVVIFTATLIMEDPNNANNKKLAGYNDFLKSLATEKKCTLVDLNAAEQAALTALGSRVQHGRQLTVDGVHMNLAGQQMMATHVLKGFGLNDSELKNAQESWLKINGFIDVAKVPVSVAQYNKLNEIAYKRNTDVGSLLEGPVKKAIDDYLAAQPK